MKNVSDLRKLLSLTQEDMAMPLGISRGHYSMYELGRRDLPLAAKQRYAELLVSTQNSKRQRKSNKSVQKQQQGQIIEKLLQQLLLENEYQTLSTQRKVAVLTKRREAQASRSQLIDFLSKSASKETGEGGVAKLTMRNNSVSRKDPVGELLKFEIKLEVLGFEKKVLESRIKGSGLETEITGGL